MGFERIDANNLLGAAAPTTVEFETRSLAASWTMDPAAVELEADVGTAAAALVVVGITGRLGNGDGVELEEIGLAVCKDNDTSLVAAKTGRVGSKASHRSPTGRFFASRLVPAARTDDNKTLPERAA
jgi:hypothetical protein